jgi:hypothetical protein
MKLKFKILVKLFVILYINFNSVAFSQCDFQPGNPSNGLETVCFYDEFDNLLGCSYNCQVTGQQIKCGYKATEEPWPDYYRVTFTTLICYSPLVVAPLPVKLLNFSVERTDNGFLIEWTTLSEHNSDYFEIQKSEDGLVFETISVVKGAGNSNSQRDYKYTDYEIRSNISYYRLKQVDFDGKFEYLQTLSIEFVPKEKLEFINFNNEYLKILSNHLIKEIIFVSIDGKKKTIQLEEGNLIKKGCFTEDFTIFQIVYEDDSNEFKRLVIVNY